MKQTALLLILVALGGLVLWFWLRPEDDTSESADVKPVAAVEVAPLRQQEIAQTLRAYGVIVAAPGGELTIAAPYECVVRAIRVRAGTHVAPGDPLIEIVPSPDTKLELESARGALTLATQTLAATQARYDLQIATTQDLQAAQQTEQEARLKVASFASRGLDGDGHINAATAGTVDSVGARVGALVPAGTVLLTVNDDQHLEASLSVEATALSDVEPGQPVALRSANRLDSAEVTSAVGRAGAMIDGSTGSAEVRVPVPVGAPLLHGEHVVGAIAVRQHDALVAPRSAVLPDGDTWFLFTVQNDHAVRHNVVPGIIADDLVEVTGAGLKAGDIVVTLGNYELADGMAVHPGSAPAEEGGQ